MGESSRHEHLSDRKYKLVYLFSLNPGAIEVRSLIPLQEKWLNLKVAEQQITSCQVILKSSVANHNTYLDKIGTGDIC
jgi:hypothetical protein